MQPAVLTASQEKPLKRLDLHPLRIATSLKRGAKEMSPHFKLAYYTQTLMVDNRTLATLHKHPTD
jgi:hypothetical protein